MLDQQLQQTSIAERFAPLEKLDRDLKRASATMTPFEARYTVDVYYIVQSYRIRFANQITALSKSGEPHELIRWLYTQVEGLEKSVAKALDTYSQSRTEGQWLRSVVGIGPVIAAGYLAHVDITKSTNPAKLFSYSGYNPTVKWERGQKRPWNASLKRLGYLAGESFVKVQNRANAYYGKVYAARKALETQANGKPYCFYKQQAAAALREKKFGADTEAFKAYSQGMLPAAQIHARARRFAVKRLLSHYWTVLYEVTYEKPAPMPYAIAHLGHIDYEPPWNWPMQDLSVKHDEEIVEVSDERESRIEHPLDRQPIPFNLPYPTLEVQLQQFSQALETFNVPQLAAPETENERDLLVAGFVEKTSNPTLAERLAEATYTFHLASPNGHGEGESIEE